MSHLTDDGNGIENKLKKNDFLNRRLDAAVSCDFEEPAVAVLVKRHNQLVIDSSIMVKHSLVTKQFLMIFEKLLAYISKGAFHCPLIKYRVIMGY